MPQTWRVRSKPHHIDRIEDFLKRNLIAVGWGLLPDLSKRSPQQLEKLLGRHYPKPSEGIGASVGQLDYIVNQIQTGAHIVVPTNPPGGAYLGVVTGEYRRLAKLQDQDDKTGERGFQHHRPVRWLLGKQPLPVGDLPAELRAALRAQQPIVKVRGNHDSFFAAAGAGGPDRSVVDWSDPLHRSQDEDDACESVEGELRLVVRRERLREARFRDAKIAQARRAGDGHLRCGVKGCGFDFEVVYGAIGAGFIHVHHRRSLASFAGARGLDDLTLICPNCHAMIHRGGECRDPDKLQVRPR
jgi:hypothetical protein